MTTISVVSRSQSNDHLLTSRDCRSISDLCTSRSRSTSVIVSKVSISPCSSPRSSSSSFSLDSEVKTTNPLGSTPVSSDANTKDLFRKSNSLDSGYKTLSATSHGTSHTDPIDEENEHQENFLRIGSSPSSCSSSSYVVSNLTVTNPKIVSKIEFVVDDDDETDEKSIGITRKDSKSNADVLSATGSERRSRRNSLSNYSVSNYSVLLNEFCCNTSDQSSPTLKVEEKPSNGSKKKTGFATTVATFFSSKRKDEEITVPSTSSMRTTNRSRSVSESSIERQTMHHESNKIMQMNSKENAQSIGNPDLISNDVKHLTTTTYGVPSTIGIIPTQTLQSPSTLSSVPASSLSNSFSWFSRLSNRFNSSASSARTTSKTSSTGLIFENRPINLPPKSNEETIKHQVEYQKMCLEAKRAQQLLDEKEEQRQRLKLKREEFVSKSLQIWTHEILPQWEKCGDMRRCEDSGLNSKAHKLWWHGLPPRIRGKIWKMSIGNELQLTYELFSQLEQIAREKLEASKQAEDARSNHSGSFQQHSSPMSSSSSETTSTYVELIQLDVSRTFPQLGLFQQNGPYHEYLQLLLCIYVYLCPEVGYVQGHAFLAGMFLLNLDLFDSFICFSNLLNRPYFQTFYRFNNIEKYLELFSQLLNFHLPKLSAHFLQMSIEPNCFALDWFFTMYSKSLPLDVVSRIWDMFFRDGDAFIFRTAIAILSLYEERLCQMDTFHCLQFLTRLPEDLNASALFKAIDKINFEHTDCELFHLIA